MTTPSIHLWGSVIIVLDTTPRDLPKPMQIWGRCLGGPCSWRALRGQDLHWSIRWLGQGYRKGRMVSAGIDQWAYYGCILWSGQNWYIFQVRSMIFLENTWYLRFFSYNHDFRYLFAAINRHTMKLRLQTSWDPWSPKSGFVRRRVKSVDHGGFRQNCSVL